MAQDTTGITIPVSLPSDNPIICVPINEEWIPVVIGWLAGLMNPYEWQHDNANDGERIRGLVEGLIAQFIGAETCGEPIAMLRQNAENPCLLEQSTDGENWTLAFDFSLCGQEQSAVPFAQELQNDEIVVGQILDRYDGSLPSSVNAQAPNDYFNGDGNADRNLALCSTIDSYIRGCLRTAMIYAYLKLGESTILDLIANLIPPGWIKTIVKGLTGWFVAMDAETIRRLGDEAAIRRMVCCWKEWLTGYEITFEHFNDADWNCAPYSEEEQTILDVILMFNSLPGNYTSFINTLGDSMLLVDAGLTCNCDDDWCYEYDFGENSLQGWTAFAPFVATTGLVFGIRSAYLPGSTRQWINIELAETFDNATQMAVHYTSPNYAVTMEIRNAARQLVWYGTFAAGNDQTAYLPVLDKNWNTWHLECWSTITGAGSTNYWYMDKITFKGNGTNPLGSDNCP